MARGNSIIPSSSDDSDSSDEDKPSVDELVYVVNFFEDVCPKQKVQLKVLKSKLLSFQNNYKYLLDKFKTFANLNCELTTKIEQLESKTPSLTIDNNLVKKNEKLKAKLASSQDAIENLLEKMKILSIHDSELTTKLENISSTPKSILSRNS
jgi:chromosome segregation ATPase